MGGSLGGLKAKANEAKAKGAAALKKNTSSASAKEDAEQGEPALLGFEDGASGEADTNGQPRVVARLPFSANARGALSRRRQVVCAP